MEAGQYEADKRTPVGGIGTAAGLLLLVLGSGVAVFVGAWPAVGGSRAPCSALP